jgi:membrane-bound serine protease (ClpP class)
MRRIASWFVAAAFGIALASVGIAQPAGAASNTCDESAGCILAIPINGLIDDVVVSHVHNAVDSVQHVNGFLNIILVVNSGGSVIPDAELDQFVTFLRASTVPVSAWVGPAGAQALGGAAELVAGLAHSGISPSSVIGSVQRQRVAGLNVPINDETYSESAAVDARFVESVQNILGDHALALPNMPKKTITDEEGRPKQQLLAQPVNQPLPFHHQIFHTVASPAVAYLLLLTGIGLLLFEFFTAGIGIAGVVGAVCLLLAGYGIDSLPGRWWAVALLAFAGFAFGIDIQTAIPRFWTGVGLVGTIVGSVFLFEGYRVPLVALATGIIGMAIAMISGMPSMVRARFATPTIGRSSMIGAIGTAVSVINPEGTAEVQGGRWRALTHREQPLQPGDALEVVGIDGLTLLVAPPGQAPVDYRELRGESSSER